MKTKKFYRCNGSRRVWIRGGRSHCFRFRLRSCSKILNPGPTIFQIWKSDSSSDSDYNHRSSRNLPLFLLKKGPQRLLLLPKWIRDSGSWSGFSQIFGSGRTEKPRILPESTPALRFLHLLCFECVGAAVRHIFSKYVMYCPPSESIERNFSAAMHR